MIIITIFVTIIHRDAIIRKDFVSIRSPVLMMRLSLSDLYLLAIKVRIWGTTYHGYVAQV